VALNDGSQPVPAATKLFQTLRAGTAFACWFGTLTLAATSDLARQISTLAFPELKDSWSQSPTQENDSPPPCTSRQQADDTDELLTPDSPYSVAEDGPWYVMHSSNLRRLLSEAHQGVEIEWLLADFEIEAHLHDDEGDHPSLVPDDLAEHLTPPANTEGEAA